MKLKNGVLVAGVQPETLVAMMVAKDAAELHGVEFVVTSVTDGTHKEGSKHYAGRAFDMRTRDLEDPIEREALASTIRVDLNGKDTNWEGEYDVVLESTHIHIEYDPR